MRQLVEQLVDHRAGGAPGDVDGLVAGLDPAELVYLRTVQPAAVALAMLGNVTAGRPALDGHPHADGLRLDLEDVDHPERGSAEARELAARWAGSPAGTPTGWPSCSTRTGLAALTGELDPDPGGTVAPLSRPARPAR